MSAVPGSVVLPEVPGPIDDRGRDQKPPLPATIYFFIIGVAAADHVCRIKRDLADCVYLVSRRHAAATGRRPKLEPRRPVAALGARGIRAGGGSGPWITQMKSIFPTAALSTRR